MTAPFDEREPEFTPSRSEPGDPFGELRRNWGYRIRRQPDADDPANDEPDPAPDP